MVDDDDGGGLTALRLFQRWRLQKNGFVVEAVRAVDTATAPKAQGQGTSRSSDSNAPRGSDVGA